MLSVKSEIPVALLETILVELRIGVEAESSIISLSGKIRKKSNELFGNHEFRERIMNVGKKKLLINHKFMLG